MGTYYEMHTEIRCRFCFFFSFFIYWKSLAWINILHSSTECPDYGIESHSQYHSHTHIVPQKYARRWVQRMAAHSTRLDSIEIHLSLWLCEGTTLATTEQTQRVYTDTGSSNIYSFATSKVGIYRCAQIPLRAMCLWTSSNECSFVENQNACARST